MTEQPQTETRRSPLERFLGGHPVSVILKLALISLLVGFIMSVFGLDVQSVIRGTIELVRATLRDGAGLIRNLGRFGGARGMARSSAWDRNLAASLRRSGYHTAKEI